LERVSEVTRAHLKVEEAKITEGALGKKEIPTGTPWVPRSGEPSTIKITRNALKKLRKKKSKTRRIQQNDPGTNPAISCCQSVSSARGGGCGKKKTGFAKKTVLRP